VTQLTSPAGPGVDWLDDIIEPSTLPKAQRRVADVIMRNPQLASYAEIAEIAAHAEVNNSTVVRTAQGLGFLGWPDLQRELRSRYLVKISTEDTLVQHGEHSSPLQAALTRDMENLRLALDANSADDVEATIATLAAARSILVVGHGSYAAPAGVMAHLGATMGYPITLESRAGVHLATSTNTLGPGDVMVVINIWRSIGQMIATAEAAHRAGVTIIAISDMRRGRLAAIAEHLLIVPSEGIAFFQSVTATTSVVYGLLAGMQAAHPERSRETIRRTQQLWKDLDIHLD
jgi:DNA-binding MurR/RpiR family transcriptional regulator